MKITRWKQTTLKYKILGFFFKKTMATRKARGGGVFLLDKRALYDLVPPFGVFFQVSLSIFHTRSRLFV